MLVPGSDAWWTEKMDRVCLNCGLREIDETTRKCDRCGTLKSKLPKEPEGEGD